MTTEPKGGRGGHSTFVNALSLRVGGGIVFNNEPYKITAIARSQPGKHGSAKLRITAKHWVRDAKKVATVRAHDTVEIPEIEHHNFIVVSRDRDDGYLSLMSLTGGAVRSGVPGPEPESTLDLQLTRLLDEIEEETSKDVVLTMGVAMAYEFITGVKLVTVRNDDAPVPPATSTTTTTTSTMA